jgi:hypothetical protein
LSPGVWDRAGYSWVWWYTWETEIGGSQVQSQLGYMVSLRPAWAIQGDPVSMGGKKKQDTKWCVFWERGLQGCPWDSKLRLLPVGGLSDLGQS